MPWYKGEFFERWYLKFWPSQVRFKPTQIKQEVAFIKRVLKLPKEAKILDLCCGQGRHLIPLTKADYQMTGLDLSKNALKILRKDLNKNKLKARFIRSDMRKIPFENEFDAVINMFTSFGYLENDNEDFKVLKAVSNALKPGGKFLIDFANPGRILANYQLKSWLKEGDSFILQENHYDFRGHRNIVKQQIFDGKGKWYKNSYSIRLYTLVEMKKLLGRVGLKVIRVFGNTHSNFKYTNNSNRLVILSVKK